MPPPPGLKSSLEQLWARIRQAEERFGRAPGSVQLLAVTKAFGPQAIAAAAALGQHAFGENYAQEAVAKMEALQAYAGLPPLEWHFIGPIQSNKTRLIAEHFHWVQSVDRISVARRLSVQRPATLPPLQALVEVNISGEASKGGVPAEEALDLALQMAALPQLRLRGLMAIPQPGLPFAEQRASFARLRALFEALRTQLPAQPSAAPGAGAGALFDTLSMGMSADFEAAIAEGSTMVRVGSAIFGERP
jgi:hypothetical protein